MLWVRDFKKLAGIVILAVFAGCSSRGKVSEAEKLNALYEIGSSLYGDGRFPEAIEKFEAAYSLAPERFDVLMALGMTYLAVEKTDLALNAVSKACQSVSVYPECWNNLSIVHLRRNEGEKAKVAASKALEVNTYSTPELALSNYAQAALLLGQYPEAKASLEKAIRLSPESCLPRLALAKTWVRMQDYEEALRIVKTAISRCPLDAEIHIWQAYIYYKLGQRRSAQIKYNQIVDLFKQGQAVDFSRQCLERLQKKIPLSEP